MKKGTYTFEPRTYEERDEISAFKLALEDYARGAYSIFVTNGSVHHHAPGDEIEYLQTRFQAVERDEYGRDMNGTDVDAAESVLDEIESY